MYRLDDKTMALRLTAGGKYEGGKVYTFDSETKRYKLYNEEEPNKEEPNKGECDKKEHNKDGKITLYEKYMYDSKTNKCKKIAKYEYGYDEKGNETLSISYEADNSGTSWIPKSKYIKKFDSNGNQILSEDYEQDDKTKALKISRRKIQKYNSNGKKTLSEYYCWISSKNALEIDSREKTEYDSKGYITHWERWGGMIVNILLIFTTTANTIANTNTIATENYFPLVALIVVKAKVAGGKQNTTAKGIK